MLQGDRVHWHWVEIPNAATRNDVATEAALDAAGAFGFVRLEDGAFRPNAKREFWFNARGDQSTSGIVDARRAFGRDTFLFDVQAHAPTTAPEGKPVTVEDGQLLLLHR